MKLKDLFKSTKIVQSSSLQDLAQDVESQEYIESYSKDRQRFLPNVDYSDPANFAIYGSAEKYYTDSFTRIRNTYPYDGSEKEKIDWLNESTFIDMYIFENKYPRCNGHVKMGYPSWGTLSGTLISGYGKSDSDVYIKTFGGPNESALKTLKKKHEDANIYKASKTRESNLQFKLESGVTLEMWLKKPAFTTAKTEKEVLFDLWNGAASSSAQYGRLRLELTGASSGSPFLLTLMSGASGSQNFSLGTNLTTASITDWTHVAVSMKNDGANVQTNLYINGALNQRQSISGAAIGEVTGSLISFIGALQTAPSGASTVQTGAGKFSGSLDEFRYWKTERNSKDIGRYYWTNIGGGTNSDDANTNLGVYYKFNEGITTTSSIDSVILDYSGRVSNGTWTGYQEGARSTDSAIVLSKASTKEFKDPTIYSSHPDYKSTLLELENSGNVHDLRNNSALFHTMPAWITEDDDTKEGNLKNLTQIMGSYFDNLHLHIKELNSLKDVYSHFQTNVVESEQVYGGTITSASGTVKPLPFADRLLTNAGFVAPELFADSTVLESLAARSEDEHYEMKLHDVKNQIYQNVYSCLTNIYKQKGTNSSFRNVLHSFGVDEDVVKINFYGDNVDFEIEDRYTIKSSRQRFVDFNSPDRFAATVYQYASGTNSLGFISGTAGDFEKYIPISFEVQTVLPDKLPFDQPFGFTTPFVTASIVGIHEANAATPSNYKIPTGDKCGLDIYTTRDERESKRVRFHLSSSALGVHLSSSLYDDHYKNNEWLLAFRMRNNKAPSADLVLSSSLNSNYIFEFIGYNTFDNSVLNSFNLTATVTSASAHNFLNSSKRIYAGAKRENFTGSVQTSSDHKIGFVRYWMNYLEDDTIKAHSYDSSNYGANSPFRSAYFMEDSNNDIKVPEIETLLLAWDFNTISTSDASGQFTVLDTTSGSGTQRYNSTFESLKRKFYHGRGDKFMPNDEKAIDIDYLNVARSTYPEILQGSDMIEIRTQDDIKFTKNTLPQDYYIAFEKSMAQTVSEEMIKYMSSVKDFNNLIGRPVNRYRMEYKDLSKLRQLFFEKIRNEPDLDKYLDYYKWLDDALGQMLVELVPASLKHSDGINNVIENYIFARDKYFNKFPTIEFKAPVPEGGMNSINRHLYPWKTGHAPLNGTPENENCFWWLNRAERDRPPLSGSASGSNNTRVKVFQARNSVLNRSFTTAQHFAVDRTRHIHAGTNYEDNKKRDYVWSATKEVAESPLKYGFFGGFPLRYILTNSDMMMALEDCNDERPAHEKIKRAFFAADGLETFQHSKLSGSLDGIYKGGMVMPFNIMSSSVTSGYAAALNGSGNIGNIDITNIHSDTTDNTNVVPLQGPFSERWVGGHQHRHAPINRGSDTESSRAEGYKILTGHVLAESGAIGVVGADYPYPYSSMTDAPHFRTDQAKARYYREERAKRPLNIRNIKTSGSIVGNYQKNYQFVNSFSRVHQRLWMREEAVTTQRHNSLNKTMPQTTQEASLIARGTGARGNTLSNFHTSSLYLGFVKDSAKNSVNTATDSIMASKFSAPGSFETMSDIFLDLYGREKSVYNALPFRNLTVRGSGSGESGTFRVTDIHGNRYGLLTHLTRHSAKFGIDSVVGSGKPSFHKVNRNPKWDASEQSYDHDNYWIQHQIPQSDFQYKWVKSSHTASLATSSMAGHLLSRFSEPSGTTARYPYEHIDYAVPSQSSLNIDRTGQPALLSSTMDQTLYGFPTWEQIRNNDRNININLKKAYGYNVNTELDLNDLGTEIFSRRYPSGSIIDLVRTQEESRVIENIPNFVKVAFRDSQFQFIYPYVNMRYHFMNKYFFQTNINPNFNETMYERFYSYYSNAYNKVEPGSGFTIIEHRINQNIFPRYIKHTKFSVRHRHFYISHFWTDGENNVYNKNTSETGSYQRLYEVGRREQSVTASLWKTENLNTQTTRNITSGIMTNIIPSQSIWSMDSRTNFTTSNPVTAASNSAGAVGVLQNQDHHFHNNTSKKLLIKSGSASDGAFQMSGSTVFGTKASGSFTVRGMVPTGDKATGSFFVTSSNTQGTTAQGQFTTLGAYAAPISASYQFRVRGREVPGQRSTAKFTTKGAVFEGSQASRTITFDVPARQEKSFVSARFSYEMAYSAPNDFIVFSDSGSNETKWIIDAVRPTSASYSYSLSQNYSSPTASLEPNVHRRALRIGATDYLRGALVTTLGKGGYITGAGINTPSQPIVLNMLVKIPDAALASTTKKKYMYCQTDDANGTLALEIYFGSGASQNDRDKLYVVQYWMGNNGNQLYTIHQWNSIGGDDNWRQFTFYIWSTPDGVQGNDLTALYIDGVKKTRASFTGGGTATQPLTSSTPTNHSIMGVRDTVIAGAHGWTGNDQYISSFCMAFSGNMGLDPGDQLVSRFPGSHATLAQIEPSQSAHANNIYLDGKLEPFYTATGSNSSTEDKFHEAIVYYFDFGHGRDSLKNPDQLQWPGKFHNIGAVNCPLGPSGSLLTLSGSTLTQVHDIFPNSYGTETKLPSHGTNLIWDGTSGSLNKIHGSRANWANDKWARKKSLTEWATTITNAYSATFDTASFSFHTVTSSEPATTDYITRWYTKEPLHNEDGWYVNPNANHSSTKGGIPSGTPLNYVTVYARSKSTSNSSTRYNFGEAPVSGNQFGALSNEQYRSIREIDHQITAIDTFGGSFGNIATTAVPQGNVLNVGGTQIRVDHHSSSLSNAAKTYNNLGKALQSTNTSTRLRCSSYPTSGPLYVIPDQFTMTFWYARDNNGTNGTIFTLEGDVQNVDYGAMYINSRDNYIAFRVYQSSTVHREHRWYWSDIRTDAQLAAKMGTGAFDEDDFNHYSFQWNKTDFEDNNGTAGIVLRVNGEEIAPTSTSGTGHGTGTSFGATNCTGITLMNRAPGSHTFTFDIEGKLTNFAIITNQSLNTDENYARGRALNQYANLDDINDLAHYYPLNDETDFPAVGGNLSSVSTIKDENGRADSGRADLTVEGGANLNVVDGIPIDEKTRAQMGAELESVISTALSDFSASYISNFNITITANAVGTAANGTSVTELGSFFNSSPGSFVGGVDPSGSTIGHRLSFAGGSAVFHVASSPSDAGNNHYIDATGVTDVQYWNALSQSIKDNTAFTTINITGAGSTRTFHLTASATGTVNNANLLQVGSTTFTALAGASGGTNRSGVLEGHTLTLKPSSTSSEYRVFALDFDGAGVSDNTPPTYRYVQSSQSSDANFWNALKSKIEGEGYDVSYAADSPSGGVATFTVTSYKANTAGNSPVSNLVAVDSFAHHTGVQKFAGGSGSSGAQPGHTITVNGVTHTIVLGAPSNAQEVRTDGVSNATLWENLRTAISSSLSGTYNVVTSSSGTPRLFTVTSVATGSAQNPNLSRSGNTFSVSNNTAGTDETGAENGDSITIGGSTFTIDLAGGLGTGSNSAFRNALSKSIKDNTVFDTINITSMGGGYHRLELTSSVTGTAHNVSFSQNSNGSRNTFTNLVGAGGGTDQFGIGHFDHIIFKDTEDSQAGTTNVRFLADTTGTGSFAGNYTKVININTGGVGSGDDPNPLTGSTDEQKSDEWWNKLSASIKANTIFDDITIVKSNNVAVFHLTASETGSKYNNDIVSIHMAPTTPPAGHGFEAFTQTTGGTDETGARAGNSITLGDGSGSFKTFTIVSSSSPGPREINAANVTDSEFFNAMSASIKEHSPYGIITIDSSSIPATFRLTSSRTTGLDPYTGLALLTGSNMNFTTAFPASTRTFRNPVGQSGGKDGVFKIVKFTEIIPQPRYAYPHTLTSPGSVRAPSAKSNLGLINPDYKLRSNHFNLTRSLGGVKDGVFDNTSRWTTPDLSGLTPYDKDYNTWYENIRVHNKHYSLVPEFRISSHIPKIIKSGDDLFEHFGSEYWLELTGTSFDDGTSVATNKRPNQSKFVSEFSVTTNIKNIDTIAEDNRHENVHPIEITLTCDAIKKFLPYEGFYPQTRTVQMCEAFASSYGKHFRAEEADPKNTNLEFPSNNILAQSRPIFDAIMSPGLLYNTIKSGMAVDYPILLNKMITGSYRDPYGGFNHMIRNEYFSDRLPFETLVAPESYLNKKTIVDANPHPSSSFNLKTRWTGQGDENYKLMANNFFAETIEFFLQGGKTSRITSLPDTDPKFGVVLQDQAGRLPVYRAMFRVYKSKKVHPYLEISGANDVISSSTVAFDKYHNRPPSGTNYFLKDYGQLTGTALEYDIQKVSFPRPQFNPYAEVETITMYSQPNAFGPPCAGGVTVNFAGFDGSGNPKGGPDNNTTYMMYDSTNGYNSPFTPPYYDGEAWAMYTFTPTRAGKHTLDEIVQNTTVKYLRYEINHEQYSFGDRGTYGPQGFAINDNAMQIDASFDLFEQISVPPASFTSTGEPSSIDKDPRKEGKAWVIQSKFETPILDFSKYLNREYNAEFESDVTSNDLYESKLSLSGATKEPDTLSSVHASLASVCQVSGILNPIGMWHQYGEFPQSEDKGIFMQLVDVPPQYTELGTEMTIPNPKYTVVQPIDPSCDASEIDKVYNLNAETQVIPYFRKQENRRRLEGADEFAAIGGAIQVLNNDTGIIIDTELREEDLQAAFGTLPAATASNNIGTFSVFNVFRDTSAYPISVLTGTSFTTGNYKIFSNGADVSTTYARASSGSSTSRAGHFAASYYHIDRPATYAPLLIATKNLNSLKYDFGDFRNGFFEGFLKDFSIGVHYLEQSPKFGDSEPMECVSSSNGIVFAPKLLVLRMDLSNNNLSIANLSTLKQNEPFRAELLGVNAIVDNTNTTKSTFKATSKNITIPRGTTGTAAKKTATTSNLGVQTFPLNFKLIPNPPTVQTTAPTGTYGAFEPMFVRGSVRFNQSNATGSNYDLDNFASMSQHAPQNDNNFSANPSTVRWGQFMHNEGSTALTKSLADLVGFSQEKVKMGVTSQTRVISEAIVAIPYIEEGGVRNYLNLDKYKIDKYLFERGKISIDRNSTQGQQDDPPFSAMIAVPIEGAGDITDTSTSNENERQTLPIEIARQISLLEKYSFPPHLDFIKNNINPVAMYIFEFKKELNRKELNDMWQGVRSKSLENVSFQRRMIKHTLSPDNLMGSLNGNGVDNSIYADPEKLKSLKWLVFKVKQKANKDYFKKMASDLGDSRFEFESQNTAGNVKDYGYNWPYDYFSLVENAKLSVQINFTKMPSSIKPGEEFISPVRNGDLRALGIVESFEEQYLGAVYPPESSAEAFDTPYVGSMEAQLEDEITPVLAERYAGTTAAADIIGSVESEDSGDTGGGGTTGSGGGTPRLVRRVDIEFDGVDVDPAGIEGDGTGSGDGGSGGSGTGGIDGSY